jgi:TRAP-type C4-dicarboxylate transport system permease small subunit
MLASLRAAVLAIDRVTTRIVTLGACVALALAAGLACYQIVMRYVVGLPASWAEPVVQLSVVYMVYLGLAVTFRRGALVSIDLLQTLARGPWRTVLRWFILIAVLTLLWHMFWYGWAMAARAQANTHPMLGVSMMWTFLSIPVGAVFATIAVIAAHLDPPPNPLHGGK